VKRTIKTLMLVLVAVMTMLSSAAAPAAKGTTLSKNSFKEAFVKEDVSGERNYVVFTDKASKTVSNYASLAKGTQLTVVRDDGKVIKVDKSYGIDRIYKSVNILIPAMKLVGIGSKYGFLTYEGKLLENKTYDAFVEETKDVQVFYLLDKNTWTAVSPDGAVLATGIPKAYISDKAYSRSYKHDSGKITLVVLKGKESVQSYEFENTRKSITIGNLTFNYSVYDQKGFELVYHERVIFDSDLFFSYAISEHYISIATAKNLYVIGVEDGKVLSKTAKESGTDAWAIETASFENDTFVITRYLKTTDFNSSTKVGLYNQNLEQLSSDYYTYLSNLGSVGAFVDNKKSPVETAVVDLISGKELSRYKGRLRDATPGYGLEAELSDNGITVNVIKFNEGYTKSSIAKTQKINYMYGLTIKTLSPNSKIVLTYNGDTDVFYYWNEDGITYISEVIYVFGASGKGNLVLTQNAKSKLYGAKLLTK
jgi:hypothetical protein